MLSDGKKRKIEFWQKSKKIKNIALKRNAIIELYKINNLLLAHNVEKFYLHAWAGKFA